ncbi:MAG: tetratricopeptide repeat protein [Deltaproteobacteria bacterium]
MKKKRKDVLTDKADSQPSLVSKGSSGTVGRMRSLLLINLVLIAITLAVYWQVGDHEFLEFDDNVNVTGNSHVATGITGSNIIWAFTAVHGANWHPLTWLSHQLDAQLYGMDPRGHHLTSVVIHTVSAVVLLLLLFRLTGSLWQSAFVAALFALHPSHVESVAWVAERKDVLSAFFCFLTLLIYTEYVRNQKPATYMLTLAAFVLGLMSKPMLVTLPVVMLLLDFWPLDRFSPKEQEPVRHQLLDMNSQRISLLKEKIPFFACSLLSAAITIYAQRTGGAMSNLDAMSFGLRIENAIVAYGKYIGQTLWPHDLAIIYPMPSSYPLWQTTGALLVLVLASAAAILVRRRHPYLLTGWFWFLATLIPVIGLIQVGIQSMADRYMYIPQTGLFIMAAWGVPAVSRNLPYRQYILGLLAGAVMIASTALTWHQLGYWRTNLTLFQHAIDVTSGNFTAHGNVGLSLFNKGDIGGAIREYQRVIAIKPNDAKAHNNLGLALAAIGVLDGAIREYQLALSINPNFPEAHNCLGNALAKKGDLDAAVREYQQALAINPNFPEAHNNLGFALFNKGDLDAAIREYQQALAINPNFSQAQNNLSVALERKRR